MFFEWKQYTALIEDPKLYPFNSFANLIGEEVTLHVHHTGFFEIHGIQPEVIDLFPPKSFTLFYAIHNNKLQDQWSTQNINVSRLSASSHHLIPIPLENLQTSMFFKVVLKYKFEAVYSSSKSVTRTLKSGDTKTITLNNQQCRKLRENLIKFTATPKDDDVKSDIRKRFEHQAPDLLKQSSNSLDESPQKFKFSKSSKIASFDLDEEPQYAKKAADPPSFAKKSPKRKGPFKKAADRPRTERSKPRTEKSSSKKPKRRKKGKDSKSEAQKSSNLSSSPSPAFERTGSSFSRHRRGSIGSRKSAPKSFSKGYKK